ncbi:MAG: Gfo/Idh/MocA family oxidoreductase [Bacteroidales bacterium]|jgi:predicted dehydrogenase|nr:Gfo/Idh/MocA family oxidoreductase [Bacteroidales bacterium]
MPKKIKFAIIGCGRIAQRHAEHINKYGVLKAVCDIEVDKAQELGRKYDAMVYQSIENLLLNEKDIDVVSICTPNGLHAEHSIKALNAGNHVLCEKPMAIKVHDCGEMIKAAERNNKRLFIVKQNRFNPPVVAVKKAIDEGVFGTIYSIQLSCFWNRNPDYYKNSWKGTKELDGGTLFTQFSHFVDLIYWMIGDVKYVYSITENFGHKKIIEFEDTGVIALKFYSGALGTINYTVNSYSRNMEGSLTVFGEKGTVKIGGQYLNELEYQNIENFKFKDLPAGNPVYNYGQYQGSMSNHNLVYENIIDVLTNGGTISTNSFEGLKTVEIIEKIYSSVK